jgi:hypothetical protein
VRRTRRPPGGGVGEDVGEGAAEEFARQVSVALGDGQAEEGFENRGNLRRGGGGPLAEVGEIEEGVGDRVDVAIVAFNDVGRLGEEGGWIALVKLGSGGGRRVDSGPTR